MLEEILELQRSLDLSQGELLEIVQRNVVGDTVRTIDRLTQDERALVISELLRLKDQTVSVG